MLTDMHAQWLEARGLCVEKCAEVGLTSAGPAIAIPYVVNGKKIYDKLRHPENKAATRCYPVGIDQVNFWNTDCLSEDPGPNDTLIITEGEFDAIAFLMAGYQFVVSLPSGAANSEGGCRSKAERCVVRQGEDGKPTLDARLAKFRRIVIATDGDMDGVMMRAALVSLIGDEYCWVVEYPEGAKDANEVLTLKKPEPVAPDPNGISPPPWRGGIDGLRWMVENAKAMWDDGFIDFIEAEKVTSPLKPLSCGIKFLDPHFRPVRPSLIVIGGQAGHGKSTITQAITYNLLWANPNLRASVFHAEGDKTIPVQRAKKFWKNKAKPLHMGVREQSQRDDWIRDRLAYIRPPQGALPTFDWLIRAMEAQARFRKRNVFVIDPWNQVLHGEVGRQQTKTDYIGERIYDLKRLSEDLGLIVIVAHHTTKAVDPRQPPNRYSLADSAHWANAADHLMLAWKPHEDRNATRMEIAKSKDHDKMGVPGAVWVTLQAEGFEILTTTPPANFSGEALPEATPMMEQMQPNGHASAPMEPIAEMMPF